MASSKWQKRTLKGTLLGVALGLLPALVPSFLPSFFFFKARELLMEFLGWSDLKYGSVSIFEIGSNAFFYGILGALFGLITSIPNRPLVRIAKFLALFILIIFVAILLALSLLFMSIGN